MDRHTIEKAIGFLADRIRASGNNPKPVIFHSIRVGNLLFDCGYNTDVVVAGILHDVVEDSDATVDDIKYEFGNIVASLVEANTIDTSMDRRTRDRIALARCKETGSTALLVKGADILENWDFFSSLGPKAIDDLYLEKTREFLETACELIGGEKIWQDLEKRYHELIKEKQHFDASG